MSQKPIVLGINGAHHECAACIVRGSEILAIAEEERFNGRKHARPANVDVPNDVPATSIRECLRRAGTTANQIDHVAFAFDPSLRWPFVSEPTILGSSGSLEEERASLNGLARVPGAVSRVLERDVTDRWVWVGHEVAHAASTYFVSPFEDAAVLSLDGIGEHGTGLLAHGRGPNLEVLKVIPYPHWLGLGRENLSRFVGLDRYGDPAVMALAAVSTDDRLKADLDALLPRGKVGGEVNDEACRVRVADDGPLERGFGARRGRNERIDHRDAALAYALQRRTEGVLTDLVAQVKRATGSSNICLAGRVALNSVAMGRLLNEGPFEGVFVQPLAQDAGGAVGAALWVAHQRGGVTERTVMASAYLGPDFDDAAIEAALSRVSVDVTRVDRPAAVAAEAIADGLIVGWFNRAAEVGPRALGARSILGDPRRPDTKELINVKVRHREFFRPFAPSILEEHASEWFQLKRKSLSTRFMSFAVEVRPERRQQVPAILHVDGTSRVQTVAASVNPEYHDLISEFHRRTGIPLVLNTPFNTLDEPIACSPQDALRTFLRTDLDYLVLQNYIVRRPAASARVVKERVTRSSVRG